MAKPTLLHRERDFDASSDTPAFSAVPNIGQIATSIIAALGGAEGTTQELGTWPNGAAM
jgi:hypothetical protein